jgi:hypothetical protein
MRALIKSRIDETIYALKQVGVAISGKAYIRKIDAFPLTAMITTQPNEFAPMVNSENATIVEFTALTYDGKDRPFGQAVFHFVFPEDKAARLFVTKDTRTMAPFGNVTSTKYEPDERQYL